jgi:hypothetical protein
MTTRLCGSGSGCVIISHMILNRAILKVHLGLPSEFWMSDDK